MHPVVQVAEHQDGPAEQRAQCEHLIHRRHAEQSHDCPAKQQNDRGGPQPFNAHIAERETVVRGVVVVPGAHGLPGAIDEEVMDQMAPAQDWEPVAVQKPVQPVAGKFRDNHGVHKRRNDSHEGDVQAFVKHGCLSFNFFLRLQKRNTMPLMS